MVQASAACPPTAGHLKLRLVVLLLLLCHARGTSAAAGCLRCCCWLPWRRGWWGLCCVLREQQLDGVPQCCVDLRLPSCWDAQESTRGLCAVQPVPLSMHTAACWCKAVAGRKGAECTNIHAGNAYAPRCPCHVLAVCANTQGRSGCWRTVWGWTLMVKGSVTHCWVVAGPPYSGGTAACAAATVEGSCGRSCALQAQQ
jgi:hypothetical protein